LPNSSDRALIHPERAQSNEIGVGVAEHSTPRKLLYDSTAKQNMIYINMLVKMRRFGTKKNMTNLSACVRFLLFGALGHRQINPITLHYFLGQWVIVGPVHSTRSG
jgi:ABC-type Na+ transport system ATPase subunit NatA